MRLHCWNYRGRKRSRQRRKSRTCIRGWQNLLGPIVVDEGPTLTTGGLIFKRKLDVWYDLTEERRICPEAKIEARLGAHVLDRKLKGEVSSPIELLRVLEKTPSLTVYQD